MASERFGEEGLKATRALTREASEAIGQGDLVAAFRALMSGSRVVGKMEGELEAYLDEAGPRDAAVTGPEGRQVIDEAEAELVLYRESLASSLGLVLRALRGVR
jgi:hypothetical protein